MCKCKEKYNFDYIRNLAIRYAKLDKKDIAIYKIYAAPMNAAYKNSFNYDVAGTSLIRVKIVSIPPPMDVG